MALRATLVQKAVCSITGAPDLGNAGYDLGTAFVFAQALADGSGLNQANKVFQDHAAATTTYDLDAASGVATLGTQLSFSRVVYVGIKAASTNSAAIAVGGDFIRTKYLTANGDTLANVTIPIHIGGFFHWCAPNATGVAVTATTGDEITCTVTATDAYDIVIIGS